MTDVLIIGAGPAGLMAAEAVNAAGIRPVIADAKPTVGRKLLMAGKSGLNLTKDEPIDKFLSAYGEARDWLEPMLRAFGPEQVQDWVRELGQEVFTGSSGRVFPKAMKSSPLLRAWLGRLDSDIRTRWRWTGWDGEGARFDTPDGPQTLIPKVTILALGGASWARLGSDGKWAEIIDTKIAPFQPANMGFRRNWSEHMAKHFGAPVKPVRLSVEDQVVDGEFVVTGRGVEGGAIYAVSKALRDGGSLTLDLLPGLSVEQVVKRLAKPRGKASMSNHLRKSLGLTGVKAALLREAGPLLEGEALAKRIKTLPLSLDAAAPLDEAISTAGGVRRDDLTEGLMLRDRPGVFCVGEMLDWEAPTGGYLLTGCLATGLWAGKAAVEHLRA